MYSWLRFDVYYCSTQARSQPEPHTHHIRHACHTHMDIYKLAEINIKMEPNYHGTYLRTNWIIWRPKFGNWESQGKWRSSDCFYSSTWWTLGKTCTVKPSLTTPIAQGAQTLWRIENINSSNAARKWQHRHQWESLPQPNTSPTLGHIRCPPRLPQASGPRSLLLLFGRSSMLAMRPYLRCENHMTNVTIKNAIFYLWIHQNLNQKEAAMY
jgi:hypothetical protein